MKKSTILFLIALIGLAALAFYFLKEKKDLSSFEVCYSPGNCKTVLGAPSTAVKENMIGSPNDFHRAESIKHVETKADFQSGRFDEKYFYFSNNNKVFYFINAKIKTGFSEDAGILEKSDAKTFEIIDANFARDKKQVYARPDMETPIATKVILGADPKTFETLDWPCARDKNNYYKFAEIVTKDECQK